MIRIQILTLCQHCSGQAYLPVGEEVSYSGRHYTRYRPCPQCQGSGSQPKWIDLQTLVILLEEAKLTSSVSMEVLSSEIAP